MGFKSYHQKNFFYRGQNQSLIGERVLDVRRLMKKKCAFPLQPIVSEGIEFTRNILNSTTMSSIEKLHIIVKNSHRSQNLLQI